MSGAGEALADAALRLLGSPFRLHGRDPATGLDCVGVCVASLAAIGQDIHVPATYRLRNRALGDLAPILSEAGLIAVGGPAQPGDILLLRLSPIQFHLVIGVHGGSFVHAHAGLRRVVQSPAPNLHPVVEHWRLLDPS